MRLLEKIVGKALKIKKKDLKYPALMLSGVAEWVIGTQEEGKANKKMLTDGNNAFVGPKDYALHQAGMAGATLAEGYVFWKAFLSGNRTVTYAITADLLTRVVNDIKGSEGFTTGIIGTVRTIGYKLTGKLKRDEDDAELEDDNPFDDATSQISTTPVADAEDDDEGPDFGMGDEDDSENTLF